MRRWFSKTSAAVVFLGGTACTVEAPATSAERACAPSPAYFAAEVWPGYLVENRCATSGCHDFDGGHGTLRLRPPMSGVPGASRLEDWPADWRENYLSALQLIDCVAPRASRLLTVPEGWDDLHPPGPIVLDRARAVALVTAWVTGAMP